MIQPDKLTGYFWASFWRQLDGYVQIDLATVPSGLQYATASDSTPRCIVRSANKSSTSPRLFSSRARAPSPQAWQRKIALNTAQMETKSRPKDAHRGIERRVRYSASVGLPVDCAVGWPDSHTETLFGRLAYITVLSCHCTWRLPRCTTHEWRGGAVVGRRTCDQDVARSIPGRTRLRTDSGQVVHTQLPRRRHSSLAYKTGYPCTRGSWVHMTHEWRGGAMVGRRTCDQDVARSILGWDAATYTRRLWASCSHPCASIDADSLR